MGNIVRRGEKFIQKTVSRHSVHIFSLEAYIEYHSFPYIEHHSFQSKEQELYYKMGYSKI